MKKELLRFTLYVTIIGTLTPAFVVAGASDVPFANEPFDVNNIPAPVPPPREVRDFFQLDPYYQQWINVRGFPVLASSEVSSYTVKEAAWQIGHMVGQRPDILKAMAQNKARFSIVPHNKHLPDIPEYDFGRLNFFWEMRARGIGSWTTTSPEENIICGDSNYCYAELIHEFAHQLHGEGLNRIDSTFDTRLETMYNVALNEGLYQNRYAGSNRWEYWAEGVGSWFNGPHPNNVAHTRLALKKYDPRLAKLLTEIFGDRSWRYTPPATRTHLPHLQGFNPQEAPIYQRPPRLLELEKQLWDPNSDGGSKWVNLKLYDPSGLSHLKTLTTGGNHTEFLFGKLIGTDLALYSFNADGKKILHQYITSADFLAVHTEVGAIWLIQDHTGKDLAVFRAEKQVGRVLVTPNLHLITPGLSKISGDNQTSISGSALATPFVVEVRGESLSVLEGISVMFTVTAGDGTLSVTRTTTDENGRAESTLTLGPNQGTNTVSVSAAGIVEPVFFNAVAEAVVDIPDTNLRTAIEKNLGKASGVPINTADMERLTRLEAKNANISDLTGLEHATNLTFLGLSNTGISDISPLGGLTNLTTLMLQRNAISDISPLAGLTNLTSLMLWNNAISDISPLGGLTNLTWLNLDSNAISDISPVSGLTNLTRLGFWGNTISDISPLVANTGLGSGDTVEVRENPLNRASIKAHIPALQNRGVTVEFDNVSVEVIEPVNIPDPNLRTAIEKALGKASGVTITTLDMAKLNGLNAPNASITDLTGLEHAINLTELFLWDNNITDISVVADLINLTGLHLGGNKVLDISPVAGLTRLTALHLPGNNISDALVVAGLTRLTYLNLNGTNITDLSFLSSLTNLSDLYLGWNNITDISVLSGLTNLTVLWLMDNNISDLSPLVANTGLGKGDRVDVSQNPPELPIN